ncbi:MAG: hypothetical protein L0Y35_02095 [Flammeovirgaceae bacterium]|nr:hypothetical protein [Flammeovirgaceae bacterium]
MKRIINKPLAWLAACATLFSFTEIGGESYTISLNDKVLVKQHVWRDATIPSFTLDGSAANDQLTINYNECGQIGKKRTIALKDDSQVSLKEWRMGDGIADMKINVKEIIAVQNKSKNSLQLVYSSFEVSKGRVLASLKKNDSIASKQ